MPFPTELLNAVMNGNGRIVFVLGAGCSCEEPTALPTAAACARELHRRLINEDVLDEDACSQPEDLEAVVDAVLARDRSKSEIIDRLPVSEFRRARPNLGHNILAALILEEIVGSAVTINFDLAMETALTNAGAVDVGRVTRASELNDLVTRCVVYLHGTADSPHEQWTLSSAEVAAAWDDWREPVVARMLAAPVVVFAGMGTLVGALMDRMRSIGEGIPDARVYCVNPDPPEDCDLVEALDLSPDEYIRLGWCEFARQLGDYLNRHHIARLESECDTLAELEDCESPALGGLLEQLTEMGLLSCGKIRAEWFWDRGEYTPWGGLQPRWPAELVQAAALLADALDAEVSIKADGTFIFERAGRRVSVGVVHGMAAMRWAEFESKWRGRTRAGLAPTRRLDAVLVDGIQGMRPEELTTPPDIVDRREQGDIIDGPPPLPIIEVGETREAEEMRARFG